MNKLRQLSNQKHRQPNNADLRHQYCEELKQYKNTLRKTREKYIQNQLKTRNPSTLIISGTTGITCIKNIMNKYPYKMETPGKNTLHNFIVKLK